MACICGAGGTQQFQLVVYPLPRFLSHSGLPVDALGRVVARFVSMRVGVRDLTVSGKLRISFRPLLNKLPVVGSIKVLPILLQCQGASTAEMVKQNDRICMSQVFVKQSPSGGLLEELAVPYHDCSQKVPIIEIKA